MRWPGCGSTPNCLSLSRVTHEKCDITLKDERETIKKDYSFKKDKQVSSLTLEGRVIVPYTGHDKHVAYIQKCAEIGAARLWYDKPKKQFYLLITLSIETAGPTPKTHTDAVGVDVGIRYLAVTATKEGEQSFYTGKWVVPKANHYARLRKRLQRKGTRSATHRLVAISPVEARRQSCGP